MAFFEIFQFGPLEDRTGITPGTPEGFELASVHLSSTFTGGASFISKNRCRARKPFGSTHPLLLPFSHVRKKGLGNEGLIPKTPVLPHLQRPR